MDRVQSTRFSFRRKGSRNKEARDKEKEYASVEAASFDQLTYLSAQEMTKLFAELVDEYAFSVDQVLELSGFSCAVAIAKMYPKESLSKSKGSILVCCGPGKNGATGLVCARHLKLFGYKTTVFYPKPPHGAAYVFYHNLATQCEKADIPFLLYLPSEAQLLTDSYNLIVDAIFGCGYQPPMAADFISIVQTIIKSKVPVISLQVPSGWTSESDNGVDTAPHPPSTVVDVPTAIQPEMLISLLAPAACSRHFTGRYHLLGGRFLPADLIKKYDLDRLPLFPGLDVVVDLKTRSPLAAGSDGESSFRNRKDATDDDFPPPPTSKETRGRASNED